MHEPDLCAMQRHVQGPDDVAGRNARKSCLRLIHGEHIFHLIGFDVIIHIHHASGGLEKLSDIASDCQLAHIIMPIHFCDENGLYWWAWRHLYDLYIGAVQPCNVLDRRPETPGDLMTLRRAVILRDEINLQIHLMRLISKIVMSDQAI